MIRRTSKHKHRIDAYEIDIQIWPLEGHDTILSHRFGKCRRTICADNAARITRRIRFAADHRASPAYSLWYTTRNGGFLKAVRLSHPNEAPPQDRARYADDGTEVVFKFIPQPSTEYSQTFEVYKGFDPGHRHVHFHIHEGAHIASLRTSLDLTAYAQWPCTIVEPVVSHDPNPHDEYCTHTDWMRGMPMHLDPRTPRRWIWEGHNISSGSVSMAWDLLPRKMNPKARKPKHELDSREITLNDALLGNIANADDHFLVYTTRFCKLYQLIESGVPSLTKAAKALRVTTGTLSRNLDDLEDELQGARLILRDRPLRITANGHYFHHWLKKLGS